ncbi:toll/interleukin-1 receptor domain-containing protein [Umezawaea sp. NPDC059074]|uniref:toll/interleukin-1 receptor domain-containing protein n=1 Tax=Umezawaea sp. NPDC059074 TaxID=3346716 RepID=UPI00369EE2B3
MDRQRVFLSYSRRDFAFAEALAATFERQGGVEPWFDAQRLDPGTDWGATIDAAIDRTDVLVLVASRTALESSYVTDEWRRALAAGKTVHVCLVGPVVLPEELAGCPVHDLRSRFWRNARIVGELIAAGETPSVARVRPPSLLPAPVFALLATCLAIVVALPLAVRDAVLPGEAERVDVTPLAVGLSMAMVATAVSLLVVAARVPWRRTKSSAISYNLGFTALYGYFLLNEALTVTARSDAQVGYGAALLVAGVVGGALMTRSRSVYLWMPTGEGYYQVRQRILGLPVRRRRRGRVVNPKFSYQWEPFARELAAVGGDDVTAFEVRSDHGDERIARAISAACVAAGLVERAGPDSWVLRLVSSKTDYAGVSREVAELGTRVVCVLVDSLRLPEDSVELRQRQWLDFRQQTPEGLYNLLRLIRGLGRDGMDSAPIPLAPGVSRIPFVAHGFAVATRTHLVCVGAFSLGLLAAAPSMAVIAVGLVSLVPMAMLWWLLRETVGRTVTAKQFRAVIGLLGASVLLWTAALAVLHPALAIVGFLELFVVFTSFARPLRQLPRTWLPESTTGSRAELVRPPVFTPELAPTAAMIFGLAAVLPSFLP